MMHIKSNLNFINVKQDTIDLINIYDFFTTESDVSSLFLYNIFATVFKRCLTKTYREVNFTHQILSLNIDRNQGKMIVQFEYILNN